MFIPIITILVNLSLGQSSMPDKLKEAHITPLIKKPQSDSEELSNYMPVSNLSYISKLVERVVASRLQDHIKANQLGEKMQSAYRQCHSTETALLRVKNDLLMSIENAGAAMLVLLDLSAAFNTIDHEILLDLTVVS